MKSVPGVYDIHSPNVPSVEWIEALLKKAAKRIPAERLWVNPDCGLKNARLVRNPRGTGEHGAGGAEFASGGKIQTGW